MIASSLPDVRFMNEATARLLLHTVQMSPIFIDPVLQHGICSRIQKGQKEENEQFIKITFHQMLVHAGSTGNLG